MANVHILQLPTQTEVDESVYVPVESQTKGTRKYPFGEILEEVNDATDRLEAAIEAVDDVVSQAVPLMSSDVRGGSKLENNGGLGLTNGALGLVGSVQSSDGDVSGSLTSVQAEGHAEQFTTTGKNLLPNNAISQTIYGVTFTVNADGSVTCDGKASALTLFKYQSLMLSSGVYTLSGCPSTGNDASYRLDLRTSSSIVVTGGIDGGDGATFSLESDTDCFACIRIANGYTCNNLTFYPMLRLASITDDTYEPYTGGAPSPNPDYPQDIQVVRGRNLLDKSAYQAFIINGADGKVVTDSLGSCNVIETQEGLTYVATREGAGTSQYFWYGFYSQVPANGVLPVGNAFGSLLNNNVITAPSGAKYLGIFYGTGTPVHPQLTLGSTPQPYVPYGHVGMEVKADTLTNSLKQGAYSLSNGSFNPNNSNYISTEKIECEPSATYEVSFDSVKATSAVYAYYFNGDTFISSATITSTLKATTPSNATYLAVSISSSAVIAPSDVSNLYIGKGVLSTTIIPLPSRGWVAGLPDGTSDILTLDGAGKCEWLLPVGEYVVTGNEATSGVTDLGTNIRVQLANVISQHPSPSAMNGFCTHAPFANDYGGDYIHAYTSNATVYLFGAYETASEVLAAYAGAEILYPLATPITEDMGYIDMPSIPSDATITIPELDNLNIKYMVRNTAAKDYAEQWYERTKEVEIAPVEDAVSDLASVTANLVTHDLFYFGYDEVNGKKMISIFKRGDN